MRCGAFLLVLIALWAWAAPARAESDDDTGSCARVDFTRHRVGPPTAAAPTGPFGWDHWAWIREDATKVYRTATGTEEAVPPLAFNTGVRITDFFPATPQPNRNTRLQVADLTFGSLGWVEARAVQCGIRPLRVESCPLESGRAPAGDFSCEIGAYRQAIIRTAWAPRGQTLPVTAYNTSEGDNCGPGNCVQLQRFDRLVVFDEVGGRLLLGYSVILDGANPLVGWIDSHQVIRWDSSIGLRPRDDLPKPNDYVCGYRPEDAATQRDCQHILGGPEWYRTPLRLPILAKTWIGGRAFYRTAAPAVGIDSQRLESSARQQAVETATSKLKDVDVFFAIDGTESMGPELTAIKGDRFGKSTGLIGHIIDGLNAKIQLGASLRFGFRIYSDTVKRPHNAGMRESFPFNTIPEDLCGRLTQEQAEQLQKQFRDNISTVEAKAVPTTDGELEDYAENSFGGIDQALTDMTGCTDNLKVLFIIGDAGYDPDMQRHRGFKPVEMSDLVNRMKKSFKGPVAVYFIEPPFNHDVKSNPGDYKKAFDWFSSQALAILSGLYAGSEVEPRSHFFPLTSASRREEQDVADKVVAQVAALTRPGTAATLATKVRAGESLDTIIKEIKFTEKDVPMVWLLNAQERLCPELGEQCHKDQLDVVADFVVEDTLGESPEERARSPLVPEVMISPRQLGQWKTLLRPLDRPMTGEDARYLFCQAVTESVNQLVGTADPAQSLQQVLEHTFLPGALVSPLMRYSMHDLWDAALVQPCEVEHLARWARAASKRLEIVETNVWKPVYRPPENLPQLQCALSPKGQAVPAVQADYIQPERLGPDDRYSYRNPKSQRDVDDAAKRGKETFYWIPLEFLP